MVIDLEAGSVIWLSGPPGSGKTALSQEVQRRLAQKGYRSVILDGDDVREWLTPDANFSREGRQLNVIRVARVASMIANAGGIAIVALVSPIAEDRRTARSLIGPLRTVMVELIADEETRRRRGKPMWSGSDYETAGVWDLVIDTAKRDAQMNGKAIVMHITDALEPRMALD